MVSYNGETIVPMEYDIFVGMDVDKRSIAVTVFDHVEKIKSFKMPHDSKKLLSHTSKHYGDKRVCFVYEAGPTGYGLHDAVMGAGHACLVASPASVPTARSDRVKTNRIDSIKLGQSLRGGELKSIRVPSEIYRDLRHLMQWYNTVRKELTGYKLRVKSLLTLESLAYPAEDKEDHWSHAVLSRVEEIKCRETIHLKLRALVGQVRFYRKERLESIKSLRSYCREHEDLWESVGYLRSISGIGWLNAFHILARVGDWRNLKNAREIGAFLGLTPCESSTGDSIRRGPITRCGDKRLRNMLVEAAWTAVRMDEEFAEFYQRIYRRHPRNQGAGKAIVAVARKLTTRIYAVLTQRRPYISYSEYKKAQAKKRPQGAPLDDSTRRRSNRPAEELAQP